jgi:predicted PurR-regulated permease PerM
MTTGPQWRAGAIAAAAAGAVGVLVGRSIGRRANPSEASAAFVVDAGDDLDEVEKVVEVPRPSWVRPTIVWTIAVVTGVILTIILIERLQVLLAYLLLALFFALALEPAVNAIVRRTGWRRGGVTLALLAAVFVGLTLMVLIFIPAMFQGLEALFKALPEALDSASQWLSQNLGVTIDTSGLQQGAKNAAESAGASATDAAGTLLGFTTSAIAGVFAAFTVAMFIFYMVAEASSFRRAVLAWFPERRQDELLRIWETAIEKTGGYFYSRFLLAVINGSLFYIVLRLIEAPGAAPLAVFQGVVAAFIPMIGTYIAAIVPLVLVFLTVGPWGALVVLAYELIYQQIENYLISPKIQGKAMKLHPAVAFGAALAGGLLGGLLWAFLALPFAATIQASATMWFELHPVVDSELTRETRATRERGVIGRSRHWLAEHRFIRRRRKA